ncbi:hypothetical protein MRX96_036534 [Rhipicephalus microplus]
MNPYIADMGINLDAVNSGLRAVKALRCTVGEVFRTLTDGVPCSQGDEKKEKNFILELQGNAGCSHLSHKGVGNSRYTAWVTCCTSQLGKHRPPVSGSNAGQDFLVYRHDQVISMVRQSPRTYESRVSNSNPEWTEEI